MSFASKALYKRTKSLKCKFCKKQFSQIVSVATKALYKGAKCAVLLLKTFMKEKKYRNTMYLFYMCSERGFAYHGVFNTQPLLYVLKLKILGKQNLWKLIAVEQKSIEVNQGYTKFYWS